MFCGPIRAKRIEDLFKCSTVSTYVQLFKLSPCSTSLNDLVVMGEDSFYFTNFYQFDIKLEILLRLRLGYVGFYDGFRGHVIIRRLFIPNGLNTSPDGKYVSAVLYVVKSDHD